MANFGSATLENDLNKFKIEKEQRKKLHQEKVGAIQKLNKFKQNIEKQKRFHIVNSQTNSKEP